MPRSVRTNGTKTGKGNRWLRQALIEAANATARGKGTILGAYYQRLRKRMGHKKAIVALAHLWYWWRSQFSCLASNEFKLRVSIIFDFATSTIFSIFMVY